MARESSIVANGASRLRRALRDLRRQERATMSPEPARAEPAPTPSEAERTATLERAASDPRTLW